jgi:hypothetical protein
MSLAAASEREDRIFTAAFGIMDSAQDGEAVAAFLRVRDILHRRDSGFRSLLERCQEAERLNVELGRQNAELLRENGALRARDSRPGAAPPTAGRGLSFTPTVTGFRQWDIGLIIIAIWAAFGLLGATTAFALASAVLVCAAFTRWFSPFRLFAAALLVLAAYATAAPAPVRPTKPTASAYAVAQPMPHSSSTLAEQPRQPPAEPQRRHAAKTDCGSYRLPSGFDCPRAH